MFLLLKQRCFSLLERRFALLDFIIPMNKNLYIYWLLWAALALKPFHSKLLSLEPRLLSDAGSAPTDPLSTVTCQTAYQLGCNYTEWKLLQGLTFPAAEETQRHLIFCQNCSRVQVHNLEFRQGHVGYALQLNKWTASPLAQYQKLLGLVNQNIQDRSRLDQRVQATAADARVGTTLPSTLDYRNVSGQNHVTSVKDQGSCSCCWSFAATGAYESYLSINGFNYDLSAEAALQCTSFYAPNKRVSDCTGGYFPDTLEFLAQVGSVLDSNYPYVAHGYGTRAGYPSTPGICTEQNRIFLGNGTAVLYAPLISSGGLTVDQIKTILVNDGPQMIGMYADSGFMSYSSGTYNGCPADSYNFINHAILLIGWTGTGWIAKNQWSTSWGNAGYVELDFTLDCGMKYLMGGVTVAAKNTVVQVTMDPGYVYESWEPFLAQACLLLLLLLIL